MKQTNETSEGGAGQAGGRTGGRAGSRADHRAGGWADGRNGNHRKHQTSKRHATQFCAKGRA